MPAVGGQMQQTRPVGALRSPAPAPNITTGMAKRRWRKWAGMAEIPEARRMMWMKNRRLTLWGCAGCMEMSGTGVRTFGIGWPTGNAPGFSIAGRGRWRMRARKLNTGAKRIGRMVTRNACCAAARGSTRRGVAAPRSATGGGPASASGVRASALLWSPVPVVEASKSRGVERQAASGKRLETEGEGRARSRKARSIWPVATSRKCPRSGEFFQPKK